LTRISARLHELFDGHVRLVDVSSKPPKDIENFFLTRSLAALALMDVADLRPDQASAGVTDGGSDDGIDAVHIDEKKKIVYFVQSKWRSSSKGVQLVDFTRFRDGVKDVLALKWSSNNRNLHDFRGKIESSLQDIDTNVVMLLAHTSETQIANNIKIKISEFTTEQNKFTGDFLEFREVDLSKVVHIARSKTRPTDIDLTILLSQWGLLSKHPTKPYTALSLRSTLPNGTKTTATSCFRKTFATLLRSRMRTKV
jgi:hypothetical protein